MKLKKTLLTAALCMTLPGAAYSEGFRLNPGVAGLPDLGAITCEYFTELYPNSPTGFRRDVLTWAQGYMYAVTDGKTTDDILEGQKIEWDFDSLTDEIVSYCKAHPEDMLPEATKTLWKKLQANAKSDTPS